MDPNPSENKPTEPIPSQEPPVENPPQEQNDNTTVIPIPSNPVQQNQTEESKEEKSKSPVQVEMKQNDHSPAQMQNKESDMSDTEEVVHHKKDSCCKKTYNVAKSVLPILDWLPKYSWESLRYDVVAGLTVGIMAIPQGMAYALLADLPPIYGLYTCIVPVFAYGILGTSRCAHIGPFALVSMLVYSTVSQVVPESGTETYINAVLCLSFMVGCLLTLLGICQLGIITSLLSETVITAFTSTSAFNIGGSQLKHYLDATVTKSNFLGVLLQLFSAENIANYNYWQLLLGVSATILLYIMKELNKKYLKNVPLPNELFLVIIYVLISWGFDLKGRCHIKILGDQDIPAGFPSFALPTFDYFVPLIPGCIIVSVIAFVITFSLGKIFARKDNYKINANQELIALGLSNVFGSFLSAYPSAGSLSRTALVHNLKSKTQFHNFISPLIIIFCLYLLTDFIKYLPKSTLAAVVEINLISLFKQLGEIKQCWKVDICDFLSFLCCGIVNITVGTTEGLITGVVVSLLCLVVKLLIIQRRKLVPISDHVVIDDKKYIEYNVNLCFMFLNRDFIEAKIEKLMAKHPKKTIIVNMEGVRYIDMSGFITMESMLKNHKNIYFAIPDPEVQKHMKVYGLLKENEPEEERRIYRSMKELADYLFIKHIPIVRNPVV